MDNIGLLVARIFFSICILLAAFFIIKPQGSVNHCAKWYNFIIKLQGFDGEIKPTAKAVLRFRIWNFLMLVVFIILLMTIK